MAYILIKTSMENTNPEVIATAASFDGKLPALANYCSTNDIAIVAWSYRSVKDTVGLFVASEFDDETNYTLFQVYQLPDWEGDPEQNYWVNDIARYTWSLVPDSSAWTPIALFTTTANVDATNTTSETALIGTVAGSTTFPNEQFIDGTSFNFEFSGICTVGLLATLRLRLRGTTGGTSGAVYADTGTMAITSGDWRFNGKLVFRNTGTTGVCVIMATYTFKNSTNDLTYQTTNTTTADTTVDNVFSLTAQWSLNNSTITQRIGTISRIF